MNFEADLRRIIAEEVVRVMPSLLAECLESRDAQSQGSPGGPRDGALPLLLTTKQAAAMMGVSAPTIRDWIKKGLLKPHGTRRALRVASAELLALRPQGQTGAGDGDEEHRIDDKAAEIVRRYGGG